MEVWLGHTLDRVPAAEATASLVEQWLRAFGPGTEADIKWWFGSTLTTVRGTLAAVGAVAVDLDGSTGYVLADDLDDTAPVEPWAALLPPLDPTTMGWIEHDWYLGAVPGRPGRLDRQRGCDRMVERPHRGRLASARDR